MKVEGMKHRYFGYEVVTCLALICTVNGFSSFGTPSCRSSKNTFYGKNTPSSVRCLYSLHPKRTSSLDQSNGKKPPNKTGAVPPNTSLLQVSTELDQTLSLTTSDPLPIDSNDADQVNGFDHKQFAQMNEPYSSSLADDYLDTQNSINKMESLDSLEGGISTIIYSACLITANTVGAGILILPDTISSAGIVIPLLLFIGVYGLNIITCFYLSDLSIEQYQGGRPASMVPTSFKDIADEAFGTIAGTALAALSVLFNYCILVFGMIRFGDTAQELISGLEMSNPIDSSFLSLGYAGLLTAAIASFSNVSLSKVSSGVVAILFATFFGLLIPGIQSAEWTTFLSNSGGYFHGTSADEILTAFIIAGPIITYVMEVQKIVPSVTKLCKFDQTLSRRSILLGNTIPLLLYSSYIYISLGGENCITANYALFTAFTFATIFGSSIASSMSLSEEFESIISLFSKTDALPAPANDGTISLLNKDGNEVEIPSMPIIVESDGQVYSLPAVLLAIIPPLLIGLQLSSGGEEESVVAALDFAGGYLTPLFIWLFPAMLAWKKLEGQDIRMDEVKQNTNHFFTSIKEKLSIGTAVVATVGIIGLEVLKDFGDIDIAP